MAKAPPGCFPRCSINAGNALGDFPQAFTLVALIHTIASLDLALRRREAPSPEEVQVGATTPSR